MSCSFVSVPYEAPGGANTPSITRKLSELELNANNTFPLHLSSKDHRKHSRGNITRMYLDKAVSSRPRGEHNGTYHQERWHTEPTIKNKKLDLTHNRTQKSAS